MKQEYEDKLKSEEKIGEEKSKKENWDKEPEEETKTDLDQEKGKTKYKDKKIVSTPDTSQKKKR